MVKFIAGFIPGPVGAIARASAVGDVTGGGGSVGSMLAMGAAAALTPGSVMAARGFAGRRMAATRQQLGGFALPLRYGYGLATRSSVPLRPGLGRTQYRSPIGPSEFNIADAIGRSTRDFNERQSLMAGLSQGRSATPLGGINRPGAGGGWGVQQYTSPSDLSPGVPPNPGHLLVRVGGIWDRDTTRTCNLADSEAIIGFRRKGRCRSGDPP
jgi:hypothetical protein